MKESQISDTRIWNFDILCYQALDITVGPKTFYPQRFCTPRVNMGVPSHMVRFPRFEMCAPYLRGGGSGHNYGGYPQNIENRPKFPKIHISPKASGVQTTLGGGQTKSKESIENKFEANEPYLPPYRNRFLGPREAIFRKIACGPKWPMGPGMGCDMKFENRRQRYLIMYTLWQYNYYLTIPREKKSREISTQKCPSARL